MVAHKLMYDAKGFCDCTEGINTAGVLCSGFGVAPVVKTLKAMCKDLRDPATAMALADPTAPRKPAPKNRRLGEYLPTLQGTAGTRLT